MSLFCLLHSFSKQIELDLHLVHFNHGLREESHQEESFLRDLAKQRGVPFTVFKATFLKGMSGIQQKARDWRNSHLIEVLKERHFNKIALGHHRDDTIETLLLNLFYSGQTKAMPPRLRSDDGRNVVIRPLIYCAEDDLAELAKQKAFPIIPCDLCGSQEQLQRKRVKRLIAELHAENDNVRGNLFAALSNVRPSHLLDRELREQLGLGIDVAPRLARDDETHDDEAHGDDGAVSGAVSGGTNELIPAARLTAAR